MHQILLLLNLPFNRCVRIMLSKWCIVSLSCSTLVVLLVFTPPYFPPSPVHNQHTILRPMWDFSALT